MRNEEKVKKKIVDIFPKGLIYVLGSKTTNCYVIWN